MNKSKFTKLIDRYESGNTSIEEDQMLSDFFSDGRSENASEGVKAQFVYFNTRRNEPLPDALEARLHTLFIKRSPQQGMFRLWLQAAAVLLICFGIGWLWIQHSKPTEIVVSTGPSEVTRVVLSDSTVVMLNSRSQLSYTKNFDSQRREVHLEGEAYFEVKRDTLNSFVIHSGDITTEVLGTSFNLRYYEDEKFAEINVRSGEVFFGARQKIKVSKGDQAIHFVDRNEIEVTEASANADSWRTGMLSFENTKLKDVIHDLERYFRIHINVKNASLMECHFTGNFNHPELVDVLKVVAYSLNIQYTLIDNTCILSGQHCQQ